MICSTSPTASRSSIMDPSRAISACGSCGGSRVVRVGEAVAGGAAPERPRSGRGARVRPISGVCAMSLLLLPRKVRGSFLRNDPHFNLCVNPLGEVDRHGHGVELLDGFIQLDL